MKRIFAFISIALFLMLNSCDNSTSSSGLIINGTVIDKETQKPIEGVFISTDPASETKLTDAKGKFTINVPSEGTYIIIAEKDNYITKQTSAGANSKKPTEVIILLQTGVSVNLPPDKPILTLPIENKTVSYNKVKLEWNCNDPNSDKLLYTVFLDTYNPPTKIHIDKLDNNYFGYFSLDPGKKYFWRIKATDTYNAFTFSDVGSFSTADSSLIISDEDIILNIPINNDLTDISSNNFNGINNGGEFINDRNGNTQSALHFIGNANSYAEIPYSNSFNNLTNFTYAFWIKPDDGYGAAYKDYIDILSRWGSASQQSFSISFLTSGNLATQFYNGTFSLDKSNAIIPENQWTHIAITYSNGICKMYINGKIDVTYNVVKPNSSNYTLYIAKRHETSVDTHFKGAIDDIFIYARALNVNEINILANTK